MIAVIIPIYNQSNNIGKIIDGLKRQTKIPDNIYFIFDRCKCSFDVNEIIINSKLPIKIIEIDTVPLSLRTNDREGFYAGYARNKGIELAINDGNDKFIFIDGDCVPQTNLIEEHDKSLISKLPIITIGRRREKEYRWLDRRELIPDMVNAGFFNKDGLVINNPELIKNAMVTWSCNLGINKFALELIMKFNNKYFDKSELFNHMFDGAWGGEDTFLGMSAWYCKVLMTTLGHKSSGIEHISHNRPDNTYSIKSNEYVEIVLSNLKKKMIINPINIGFFI